MRRADFGRILARLRSLLAAGKTLHQAGQDARVRRHKSTVCRLAQRHNLGGRARAASPRQRATAERLILRGKLSLGEIAQRAQVAKSTICRWRQLLLDRQAQVEFRPKRVRTAQRCPVHGLVNVWPCVACAAIEGAKGQRDKGANG